MYIKKKELLIVKVNVWFKNGKFWGTVEYVEYGTIKKLFVYGKEETEKLFGIELKEDQKYLKDLRKELMKKYAWKKMQKAEVYSIVEDIFENFDTVQ